MVDELTISTQTMKVIGWAFSESLIFQIESIMRDKKLSEVN